MKRDGFPSIGYRFNDPRLLALALTHRSHGAPHNERLEFLGDSVINCAIAWELYQKFPDLVEGELSRLRANLVNQQSLAAVAREFDLGRHIRLGEGEQKSGGADRPSILADAVEAVIGAAFIDGGFDAAHRMVTVMFAARLEQIDPRTAAKDAKTRLQELLQSRRIGLPKYVILSTHGEAHAQRFEVECTIQELGIRCTGEGASRRTAEQAAAESAYALIVRR
jgi:ribonuclease-3